MTEKATMSIAEVGELAGAIRTEIGKAIVGQKDVVDHLLVALMAQLYVTLQHGN